jgi:4-hydroxy-3-polyprenylbenzoate decarboxylase
MSDDSNLPLVVGITGASGAVYAARLLQCLAASKIPMHVVVSPSGAEVVRQELGLQLGANRRDITPLLQYCWPNSTRWPAIEPKQCVDFASQIRVHEYSDYLTPIASGSFLTRGMVICPCSGSTLSGIVHAASNNLIVRAADVHIKEHRKLILVPRETPLSSFYIQNMQRASEAGAVVMPASPGWYHQVESIVDLVDFIVARILDHLKIPHTLMQRWGVPPAAMSKESQ